MEAFSTSQLITREQPRYLALAQILIDGVSTGKHPLGSYLPTEAELMEQFKASRFTVREAVKVLQSLGMVSTRRGVGTQVVSEQPMAGGIFAFTSDSLNDFLNAARRTQLTEINVEDITADEQIAQQMDCELGQPLMKFDAIRTYATDAGTEKVGWLHVYVLSTYDGVRERIGTEQRTVNSFIEELYGIQTKEIIQTIVPVMVDERLARRLDAEVGTAGLRIERAYVSQAGEIFEYVETYHAGKFAEISMRLRRHQQ